MKFSLWISAYHCTMFINHNKIYLPPGARGLFCPQPSTGSPTPWPPPPRHLPALGPQARGPPPPAGAGSADVGGFLGLS